MNCAKCSQPSYRKLCFNCRLPEQLLMSDAIETQAEVEVEKLNKREELAEAHISVNLKRNDLGLRNLLVDQGETSHRALRCPSCKAVGSSRFANLEHVRDVEVTLTFSCKKCLAIFELTFLCDPVTSQTRVKLFSTKGEQVPR